jgi:hypothetical protein
MLPVPNANSPGPHLHIHEPQLLPFRLLLCRPLLCGCLAQGCCCSALLLLGTLLHLLPLLGQLRLPEL